MATVSSPRIKVTLTKTMDRKGGRAKRFEGARRQWDLTPWLGENGVVRTTKRMHEPAGGFTLAFPDNPERTLCDTLSALIEPMDVVEIRMGRDPGDLPIIMRGFVQRLGRDETIMPDGTPRRTVIVQGHDYGAVFRWMQILWDRELLRPGGSPYLTIFKLQDLLAPGQPVVVAQPAGEFMRQLVEQAANGWLRTLDAQAKDAAVLLFGIEANQVSDGLIHTQTTSGHEGDLWSLVSTVADLDWNEFFIEDRSDRPYVVYRPKPYKDIDTGQFILPGVKDPGTVKIGAADLRASQLGHGAERVATWVWVDAPISLLLNPHLATADALLRNSAIVTPEEAPNSDERLFGVRPLRVTTMQVANENYTYPSELGFRQREDWTTAVDKWRSARRDELIALTKDNLVFEDGALTFKGNPAIKMGQYIELTRGGLKTEYYVTGVDQVFSPFRDWVTTALVERGTGLMTRWKEQGAPAWMEGAPGA